MKIGENRGGGAGGGIGGELGWLERRVRVGARWEVQLDSASRWSGGVKQVKESGFDPEGNEQPGRS